MRLLLPLLLLPLLAAAQRNYPPTIEGAERVVFKEVGEVELAMWVFKPEGWEATGSRPAAVFFFGGGWKSGTPEQFVPQCRYLASRGMVAAVADYRVRSRHEVRAKDCVEDCKSAVRFLRAGAAQFGIDPERILAGGGSAGGHTAACTGVVEGFEVGEVKVSSRPNAMALFNPACVLATLDGKSPWEEDRSAEMAERMGVDPQRLSPAHQVKPGAPPTIVFHGKADETVPYKTAEWFTEAMVKAGNRCELVGFEDAGHGFFNSRKGDDSNLKVCLEKLDAFLISLDWLESNG